MRAGWRAAVLVLGMGCTSTTGTEPVRPAAPGDLRPNQWQVDLLAQRETLLEADRAHARATAEHGVAEGFAASLAADVRFLPAGTDVLHGAAAARAYLAGSWLAGARMRWAPLAAEVTADGRTGYTAGTGTVEAGPRRAHLRYVAFWRREGSGAWKVAAHAHVVTTEPPPRAPAAFAFRPGAAARPATPAGPTATLAGIFAAERGMAALALSRRPRAAFAAYAAPGWARTDGECEDSSLSWAPIDGEAAATGDLGYAISRGASHVARPDGTLRVFPRKILTVWRKEPGGAWRFVATLGNPRPMPTD